MKIYKTFWRRLFATILDGSVFAPLVWILYFLLNEGEFRTLEPVFSSLIGIIYSVYFVSKNGQTFGKMAMGIIVLDKNGNKATFKQAFTRDIMQIIFSIITICIYGIPNETSPSKLTIIIFVTLFGIALLEMMTMLFNNKRRSIHDFIAGTIVIKQEKEKMVSYRILLLTVLTILTISNSIFNHHYNSIKIDTENKQP